MKLVIFDLKKHETALNRLKSRKAPEYVIEAYNEGFTDTVNKYYALKLNKIKKGNIKESKKTISSNLVGLVKDSKYSFIKEALKQRDEDFLKAFFILSNLDIVTGRKLPPSSGQLVKQGIIKDLGLKDLYKKLK